MIKVNFVYWNIGDLGNPFEETLNEIITINEIDVLILGESNSISSAKIIELTGFKQVELGFKNKIHKWVQIFYKENDKFIISHKTEYTAAEDEEGEEIESIEYGNENSTYKEVDRIQIFEISGIIEKTIFACIHFPSKLYNDEVSHLTIVPSYKKKIHDYTKTHERVFIVGDFNMNPFDYGMVEPTGFFTHHNQMLIKKDKRQVNGQTHFLYYNPCWSLLGDFISSKSYLVSKRMGGTFHYTKEKSRRIYWYLIDQIIMRKAMIDEFNFEYLKIVETEFYVEEVLKRNTFLNNKKVPKLDHLPIRFSYNFKQNKDE